jgi:hypothetical protein
MEPAAEDTPVFGFRGAVGGFDGGFDGGVERDR